jgi:hypothetical protein
MIGDASAKTPVSVLFSVCASRSGRRGANFTISLLYARIEENLEIASAASAASAYLTFERRPWPETRMMTPPRAQIAFNLDVSVETVRRWHRRLVLPLEGIR